MHCIELTITAQAPLAIGRQKAGSSVSEAETYIPGSVIRGAIAGQILRLADRRTLDLAQDGGEFQALFLDAEAAIFHNAYPAIARLNAYKAEFVTDPIRVVPATAVSSKENAGFKVSDHDIPAEKQAEKQKGGVFDTLIDRYCADLCQHPYDPSCPKDQGRIEPFSGFYSCTADQAIKHRYRSHSSTTRFLTRVGINRRRATAQDEMLYSLEVLNESFLPNTKAKYPKWEYVAYRSQIWVNDETLAASLAAFITRHSATFRLGSGVSRGLGCVKIEAKLKAVENTLKQRLQQFNAALKGRWSLWSIMQPDEQKPPGDRTFFTLGLQADAILSEDWQRTMVVSPTMLLHGYNLADDLQLHASYASYDYRAGWNAAWGLMKEMELITNRGAVFLFSISASEHWKDDRWLEQLEALETGGIGDRTAEGFGQVRICDEFHTIFRENAV